MDREAELEIVRRAYAKRVMFVAGVHDRRVEAAFASVSRERFLGRGPWPILRWDRGYVPTPGRNPVYIYDDVLVGIVLERNLNNGQPSLHALLIASAARRNCRSQTFRTGQTRLDAFPQNLLQCARLVRWRCRLSGAPSVQVD